MFNRNNFKPTAIERVDWICSLFKKKTVLRTGDVAVVIHNDIIEVTDELQQQVIANTRAIINEIVNLRTQIAELKASNAALTAILDITQNGIQLDDALIEAALDLLN